MASVASTSENLRERVNERIYARMVELCHSAIDVLCVIDFETTYRESDITYIVQNTGSVMSKLFHKVEYGARTPSQLLNYRNPNSGAVIMSFVLLILSSLTWYKQQVLRLNDDDIETVSTTLMALVGRIISSTRRLEEHERFSNDLRTESAPAE
jgi:hypothetical protein